MFTVHDYKVLSDLVFRDDYPGYRPEMIESPNGNGNWDTEKRYAHVATKYLNEMRKNSIHVGSSKKGDTFVRATILSEYLDKAHDRAVDIAIELGIPKEFWPVRSLSAMRILEYPPGAIAHPHVDFDLFTLMCYRNIPENFRYTQNDDLDECIPLMDAQKLNKQIHFGEILELVNPKFQATEHEVVADPEGRTQYSIVYFTIPDREAVLTTGETVGQWLDERYSRSRKEA